MKTWKFEGALSVEDGAETPIQDAVSISEEVEIADRIHLKLADETDDYEVDLSTLIGTATELYIESSQIISVKKDADTNTAWKGTLLVVSGTTFTKLYLSNTSGAEADVTIDVAG